MATPILSIIIPVHNEGHRLRETVLAVQRIADIPYEVVVVDDASTDGCADGLESAATNLRVCRSETPLGVAGARNRGADEAIAPVLLFLDGHCYPEKCFLSRMLGALHRLGRGIVVPQVTVLGDPTARGFGLTLPSVNLIPSWLPVRFEEPYPVPAGGGCAQMLFKAWFEQIGRYDQMRRYGVEDLELSLRSWLMGGPVHVVPNAVVAHYFRARTTCDVSWTEVVYNSLRMAHLHFEKERLERMLAYWKGFEAYPQAQQWLEESDYRERRAWLDNRRRHSADWYCEKFALSF